MIRTQLKPTLLIALGALAALTPFAIDLYIPSLPSLAHDLGSDIRLAQFSVTLYLGFFASAQLLLGPLSDVRGRRPLIGAGLVLFALGGLGCALAPSISVLLISRCLQAIGGAAIAVTVPALVRDRFAHDDYARVMTLVMLVMGLAPMVAPSLGGLVLLFASWRWVFATLLGITLLTALLFLRLVPETLPPARRQTKITASLLQYGRILRHRRALAYLGTASASFAGLMVFIVGSPFVYITQHGISPQLFGLLYGANVAATLLVSLLNTQLIPRFGAERLLQVGLAVQALAALALLALTQLPQPSLWLIVPLTGAYLGMTALVIGNAMAGFMSDFPDLAGTASAFSGSVRFGFGALSGSLVSLMHDGTATPMLLAMGLSGLLGGCCYLFGVRGKTLVAAPASTLAKSSERGDKIIIKIDG